MRRRRLQWAGCILWMLFGFTVSGCGAVIPVCEVEYSVEEDWGGGYRAQMTLTHHAAERLDDWHVVFELPTGQSVSEASVLEAETIADQTRWRWTPDKGLAAGEAHSVQFEVSGGGDRLTPETFLMNGEACTGGRDWILVDPNAFVESVVALPSVLIPRSLQSVLPMDSPEVPALQRGFVEQQGGRVAFFARNVPWADLYFEGPSLQKSSQNR